MTQDRNGKAPDYKDPLREFHPSTAVIHAGYRSRLSENAVKPPVFRTSTFEFSSATEGAKFFQRAYHLPGADGQEPGLVYSRLNNPSTEIFEDKMVALEANATHAAAFPSGMGAIKHRKQLVGALAHTVGIVLADVSMRVEELERRDLLGDDLSPGTQEETEIHACIRTMKVYVEVAHR